MSKRPQVPAALHAELTEYSSLLRALRTTHTLDLAGHLTQSQLPSTNPSDGLQDDDAMHVPPIESVSRDLSSQAGSSLKSQSGSRAHSRPPGKGKQRDTWTRWPLLAGDVHVPEWGLADEVKLIVETILTSSQGQTTVPLDKHDSMEGALRETTTPSASLPDNTVNGEEDGQPAVPGLALQALTADSAAFLTRVLAALAAHIPAVEKSLQNRIRPISWETVLDVACAGDLITSHTATVVRQRMSSLYSGAQSNVPYRQERLRSMNRDLVEQLLKHDDALLAVPSTFSELQPDRRPRRRYKKRQGSDGA